MQNNQEEKTSVNIEITNGEKEFLIRCATMAVAIEYSKILKEIQHSDDDNSILVIKYFQELTDDANDTPRGWAELYIEDYNKFHRKRFGLVKGEPSTTLTKDLENFFVARFLDISLKMTETLKKQLKKYTDVFENSESKV